MSIGYVDEKLGVAVYVMATGTGSIQERLSDAYMSFMTLTEADFPPFLVPDWQSIKGRMTRHEEGLPLDDPNRVGNVAYTLQRTSDTEAVQLAKDICNLHAKVDSYIEDQEEARRNKR